MSWLCRWFGIGCPKPAPPKPPVPTTVPITFAVFAGDPKDDNKIPQAVVRVDGVQVGVTDGAGNLTVNVSLGPHTGDVTSPDGTFKEIGSFTISQAGQSIQVSIGKPLPSYPTRDQVCGVKLTFQGLTVNTQYGSIPWFDGTISSFSPADRQSIYAAKRAKGDTHICVDISWNYAEPGQPYGSGNTVPPRDLWNDLPTFRALVDEVIREGFIPIVMLAGDGDSTGSGYNDPVGWTYGYANLMAKLPDIVAILKQDPDLTPYCLFCPGYDGVFYGWEPSRDKIGSFGSLFRSLLPNGYLAIEHNTGHIPCGEGGSDFQPGGVMQNFDVIMSEFDRFPNPGDSFWQIAARLLGPAYRRPSDQPEGDDPSPPFYLAPGTPRGPYYTVAFEWVGLYDFIRGNETSERCDQDRAYVKACGYTYTG